ncbi:hypothetical protein CEXT_660971 [Caerostris extrusa]|uniref:Uncharacterized protein n=1 Tax=Caerostris extrusa TaxID=172846 RepID=A0AAV4SYU0_CAEEX|nr:hypothetical protein CEXT_660971 [Caerostris extrusa]
MKNLDFTKTKNWYYPQHESPSLNQSPESVKIFHWSTDQLHRRAEVSPRFSAQTNKRARVLSLGETLARAPYNFLKGDVPGHTLRDAPLNALSE